MVHMNKQPSHIRTLTRCSPEEERKEELRKRCTLRRQRRNRMSKGIGGGGGGGAEADSVLATCVLFFFSGVHMYVCVYRVSQNGRGGRCT